MNLDRDFSGLLQGESGKAVLIKHSSSSVPDIAALRSGISPIFVLPEAKDMIDILFVEGVCGDGEGACLIPLGSVAASAASDFR